TVVDVYQGWCGPCKPVVSLFQKMRIEVGLDLLHFALVEADCLDVLEKYRGKCEPTFLFYTVTDEVLSGAAKCLPHEKDGGEDGDIVSLEKTCTLAIIKPDAVAHGKADEIIMKIQEAGFDILSNEERTLTEAEMQMFYQHRAGESPGSVWHRNPGQRRCQQRAGPALPQLQVFQQRQGSPTR
uniref:Nucleoside diphosphate kinase-like domain-containing protein n=1 Tax=Cricetulus griseus TaxID=10029 RepID=A0A8C2M9M2_CRIGR